MKDRFVMYPAVFTKETVPGYENYYNVTFPDVPAANTYGQGIEETTHNAWESLGLNLYDQKKLPPSSSLEAVMAAHPQSIVQYITVDLTAYAKGVTKVVPKVSKNTRIPRDLAKEAEALGLNFSAILTKALYHEIDEIKKLS